MAQKLKWQRVTDECSAATAAAATTTTTIAAAANYSLTPASKRTSAPVTVKKKFSPWVKKWIIHSGFCADQCEAKSQRRSLSMSYWWMDANTNHSAFAQKNRWRHYRSGFWSPLCRWELQCNMNRSVNIWKLSIETRIEIPEWADLG